MTSKIAVLLFIFSIGPLVSAWVKNDWIPWIETPENSTKPDHKERCSHLYDGFFNTSDSRLKGYYLAAVEKLCKPDVWRLAQRIDDCVQSELFRKFTTYHCRLPYLNATDCKSQMLAADCVLDIAGFGCNGKAAIVFMAFQMEFTLAVNKGVSSDDCLISTLQYRQTEPEPMRRAPAPKLDVKQLCEQTKIFNSYIVARNLTTDPQHYEKRAAEILCDGKKVKKSVEETNACIKRIDENHEAVEDCRVYNWDGDICVDQVNRLRCQAAIYAKECGGQSAVDVYAFETEFWLNWLILIANPLGQHSPLKLCGRDGDLDAGLAKAIERFHQRKLIRW